jgi:hypothetical protein
MLPVVILFPNIVWLIEFRKRLSHRALDKTVLTGTLIAENRHISITKYYH